jgi:hypothetical protein
MTSTGLTKNEVLKRWEINSLAFSLALPSISLPNLAWKLKEGVRRTLESS